MKSQLSYIWGIILGVFIRLLSKLYIHSFFRFRNQELLQGLKKIGAFPGLIRGPLLQKGEKMVNLRKINNSTPLDKATRKVVYTCLTGGYDNVAPLFFKPADCDFLLFTDDPGLKVDGWETVLMDSNWAKNNFLLSRMPKLLPHRFLQDYDYSIYIDGNYEIIGDITELFEYLSGKALGLFRHASGTFCIKDEAKRIIKVGKANAVDIEKQMNAYFEEGFPENQGLFECGVIIRKHNQHEVMETMETWWSELKKYPYRDQMSFPYAIWKNGQDFKIISGTLWKTDLFLRKLHLNQG